MSDKDPYQTLGVTRTSSDAEIKSAYRKLAKKLHPDMNPGKPDIEQQFKEVTGAYDLLSDKDKRAKFDRGEIDNQGNPRGYHPNGDGSNGGYSRRSGRSAGNPFGFGGHGGMNAEDIFAEFFGGKSRFGQERPVEPERGQDVSYTLSVSFIEACVGGTKRVTLADKKTIDVTIPAGTESGHKLRLRGLGQPSRAGAGAAIVEITVTPHPYFRREGHDIHLDVPISLIESVLGGSINLPTLTGTVALNIPKGANTDTVMRLKGKGVPRAAGLAAAKGEAGDMFVKLKIVMPDGPAPELATAVEKWAKKHTYDPRKKLGWK